MAGIGWPADKRASHALPRHLLGTAREAVNMTTDGSKVTAAGWPDPTDWVNRLYQAMAKRQAIYDAEPDQLLRRNKAGGMLGLVISSLMEMPAFKNDSVHLPLKDLMIFLSDLDRGRDHPWSAPFNFGGTNTTTTAQGELKVWVRAACGVLKENGFKPVEAYRHIASGLTKSGRVGRNGEPVQWRRVGCMAALLALARPKANTTACGNTGAIRARLLHSGALRRGLSRRSRMHGGTNPGAPKGNCNARKHGGYSAKTKAAARCLKAMARLVRKMEME